MDTWIAGVTAITVRRVRMLGMARTLAGGALMLIVACGGPLGPDEPPIDVEVTAEVRQQHQNEISFTVVNGSDGVVVYQPRPSSLERREDGAWQAVRPDPNMLALYVSIQPHLYTGGSDLIDPAYGPRLVPGDYRYKLDLRDEDGNLLPDEARTSNVVRIR